MPRMSVDDIARAVAESALSVEERLGFLELCEARSVADLLADRERVRRSILLQNPFLVVASPPCTDFSSGR